ncbi:Mss4-like protein [Mycena sanguinolenta]|nr:Mss4-like protein [Mycena sanguinolenta]
MSEPQTIEYRGNCHCGAFRFTFKSPELTTAYGCNCSICAKNGYLWCFPAKEDFTIVKGDHPQELQLRERQHGSQGIIQLQPICFCPTCGTSVMARTLDDKFAINMRALADVDFASLPAPISNGALIEPLYKVPEPVAVDNVPAGTNVYHGSCHCGAVGYTLLSPEKITTVKDCNCSICARDGALWTYPLTTSVTFKGLDSLGEYTFGKRTTYHGFCKVCGVAICERFIEGPDSVVTALNVRTMNDFDISALELTKEDNWSLPPAYAV